MSIKMIKTNTKLIPIFFIVIIPRTRNYFNNTFSITNSLKRSFYLKFNVIVFFFSINYITKSICNMTKNKLKIILIIDINISIDNTRQNISNCIKTISPKVASKISTFKHTFVVITKTKTWMFINTKRTGN